MTTVFIANISLDLPTRFELGQVLTAEEAAVLQFEYLKRVSTQIRWRVESGKIKLEDIHCESKRIANAFVFADGADAVDIPDLDSTDEMLMQEARTIAKDLIIKSLAENNVTTLPSKLDDHITAVINGNPQVMARARRRLEIRWQLGQEILGD
jgi:hypothetical protein